MKKQILSLFFISMSSFVISQTTYKGHVIDDKNQAIPFTSISLLNQDSSLIASTQTDVAGLFTISSNQTTAYYVKASYIGYNVGFVKLANNANLNDIQIKLIPTSKNLKSVDVIAEKKAIQNNIDKIVINADKLAVAAGGNATDILKSAPAVTVDIDGNVSLRGDKNVSILINGLPATRYGSDVTKVLQAMNASDIVSVEVINNPGAKYRSEGSSGVINIVTKKKKKPGVNGSIELNATANPDGNGNAQLGYSNDQIDINASYSARFWNGHPNNDYTTFIQSPDTNFYYESSFKGINQNLDNNASLNIGVNIDSNNRIDVGGWLFNFTGYQPNTINNTFFTSEGNAFLNTQGKSKVNWNGTFWGAYINHTYTGKDMSTISSQLFYSRGQFNGGSRNVENNLSNSSSTPYGIRTSSQENGNDFDVSIDYSKPLSENSSIDAGFVSDNDFSLNRSNLFNYLETQYSGFPLYSYKWNYRLHINGAYLSFNSSYNGLNYKLGLRAEQTDFKGVSTGSTQNIKGDYISFFPTIHLNYTSKKNDSYTLSYSRRINRPEVWQLSPWTFSGDTRIKELGNPKLKPEIINSFDFTYMKSYDKGSIVTSFYYRLKQNTFTSINTADADGIVYQTLSNVATAHNIGLDLSFQWSPKKWYSTTLNINPRFEAIEENRNINYKNFSYLNMDLNWIMNFNPTKWWLIQTQYGFTPKQKYLQGTMKSSHGLDIAMRWKVYKNNFAITLKCTDIFFTRRYTGSLYTADNYQLFNSKYQSRVLSLGFIYRFGMGNGRNKEENLLRDNNGGGGRGVR